MGGRGREEEKWGVFVPFSGSMLRAYMKDFFFSLLAKNLLSLFVKETRHICALADLQGDYGGCIIDPLSAAARTACL